MREVDLSPPSSAAVVNEWRYTPTPRICLNGVDRAGRRERVRAPVQSTDNDTTEKDKNMFYLVWPRAPFRIAGPGNLYRLNHPPRRHRDRATLPLLSLFFSPLFFFTFYFIILFFILFLTGLWYLCLLALTLHNTFRLKNFFLFFTSSSFVVGRKNSCYPKHYVANIYNGDAACFLGTKSTISNIVYAASLCKGLLIQYDVLSIH